MALGKQLVPISFGNGINTKVDPKQQLLGILNLAQNATFETLQSAKKRTGYDSILLETTTGTNITSAKILSRLRDELVLFDNTKLYSFSESLQKMQEKGNVYSVFPESSPVLNNDYNQDSVDVALLENLRVHVYHNTALDDVRYSVVDNITGSLLVSNDVIASSSQSVRLANNQNYVYIIYAEGVNLRYRRFNILTPSVLEPPVALAANVDIINPALDTASAQDKIIVAYNSTVVGAKLRVFPIDQTGAPGSMIGITGANPSNGLDIYITPGYNIIITFADSTAIKYTIFPFNLTAALLGVTTIETIANVATVSAVETTTMNQYQFVYEISAADTVNHFTKKNTGTLTGTIGTPAVFLRSVGLSAKQLVHNNLIYIPLSFATTLQSGYFVADNNGIIVTKVSPSTGGGHLVKKVLPKIATIDSNNYIFTSQVNGKLVSENGTFFSVLGVNSTQLNFALKDPFQNEVLANNLHVAGGILQMYDGDVVVEHGFHVYPETITQATIPITITPVEVTPGVIAVTPEVQRLDFSFVPGSGSYALMYGAETTALLAFNASLATIKAAIEALIIITLPVTVTGDYTTGIIITYDIGEGNVVLPTVVTNTLASPLTGGSLNDGTRSYTAIYKWTDNYGQEHKSIQALDLQVILSGGTDTQQTQITVPTLRLTVKENVVIDLYRTENAGTIFFKVSTNAAPTFNNKTVDTVTIVDNVSDTTLISREPLYTTGGVLDNAPAPSASLIATHTASNRLFLAGLENPNLLQYSKIQNQGFPVEFNDTLIKLVDPVGGDITALVSMDEKMIIFESDATFYISGQGPNNLGEQDTFTEPERVSTDVGCMDARSVVLVPDGIMFKSRKGIFLLSRGLGLTYIGAPVERYNELTITSAKVIAEFNQVRFTTSDGDCLVYNYNLNLWSTFINHQAKSAEVLNNDYYYVRSDSELFKENRTSYADNGAPIKLLLETGWMSFAQLQGFLRAYRMLILGTYKSPHKLKISVAYNFNEAFIQEKVIDPADFINEAAYGEESPYGSGSPYGGDGNVYQARIDFQKQKCQTMKLRIEDLQETASEGLNLSAITLEVGGKTGVFKVNANKKYGTS